MGHVYKNNILTPEQAAEKKRLWGTVELLINKSILKEVRSMRLRQHLLRNANKNEILGYVSEYEQVYIIRVGNELLIINDIKIFK